MFSRGFFITKNLSGENPMDKDDKKKECPQNCFLCTKNIACKNEGLYDGYKELWEALEAEIRKHEN